jgi:carbon-monoxide dehydrogenase medium subunit
MKLWNHYHIPTTTDEALALLTRYQGQARVVAGGTDLLVERRAKGSHIQEALIDISRIAELSSIAKAGNHVLIGAGVTHTQIVRSSLLAAAAACLVESCGVIGGPQVRNVATLGGNVAHALPAGDGTISLVALDAEVEIVHQGIRRWVAIQDMFLGPGKSLLDSTRDLLLRFRFTACAARAATAFSRIMRPQGVALPILGCAVWLRLDESLTMFDSARISIAPVGPTPERAAEIENALRGKAVSEKTINDIAEFAQKILHPRTSKYRASAEYRREMISVLLKRTLHRAVKRAQFGVSAIEGFSA